MLLPVTASQRHRHLIGAILVSGKVLGPVQGLGNSCLPDFTWAFPGGAAPPPRGWAPAEPQTRASLGSLLLGPLAPEPCCGAGRASAWQPGQGALRRAAPGLPEVGARDQCLASGSRTALLAACFWFSRLDSLKTTPRKFLKNLPFSRDLKPLLRSSARFPAPGRAAKSPHGDTHGAQLHTVRPRREGAEH